jgi:hypothetical protein
MAYTTIDKPDDYFNTVIYSGDDVDGRAITTGFQTDWTWIKRRNDTNSHIISDIVRGATYKLDSSSTSAEVNNYDGGHLESFTSTGFTLGEGSVNSGHTNATGGTYVSWNWKAGGTAVSNTVGDITSSVSANTTAGFSIVSWTGNNTAGATIGHGLSSTPSMIIVKNRNAVTNWRVYHQALGNTGALALQDTAAFLASTGYWNDTSPTASFVTLGTTDQTNGTNPMVAYCFAEVKGFSKFGSYTGNGSTDGTFVYTGFKPAFVMLKSSSSGAVGWITHDNKRIGFNPNNYYVEPNNSNAESADTDKILLLSNGFKFISTSTSWNASGGTYIYMAFAEQPFVTSTTNGSIPATAR